MSQSAQQNIKTSTAFQMSVQRIVEDSPAIDLQAEAQHTSGEIETPVSCSSDNHIYSTRS